MAANQPSEEETRIGWQLAGLGFEVAGSVAAGAILGWFYDRWQGTDPTGLLIGSLSGVAIGIFTLLRQALRLNRRLDEAALRRRKQATETPTPATRPGIEAGGNDEDDDWNRRWRDKWDDDDGNLD